MQTLQQHSRSFRPMKNRLVFVIALCVLICPLLHAGTAALHGKITGSNGTVIADARVTLKSGAVERTATPDFNGEYQFTGLDPALSYALRVEAEGLHPFSKTEITLGDGQAQALDVVLQLDDIHTSVLVRDGVINLEAGSAEVSQTIDSTEVSDLPVANR